MRPTNATPPTTRPRGANPSLPIGLAFACALLAGCLDVLDGAHYRPRVDATVPRIDAATDHPSDSFDVRDASRMDSLDIADEPPPIDVADDALDEDAATDEPLDTDVVLIDDVVELEASFDDVPDVIVTPDVPDIPCPRCGLGQTCCAGVCVNTSFNEQNCGGCGIVCPAPGVCQSGRCGRCPLGGLVCGGAAQRCCILGILCAGVLCP